MHKDNSKKINIIPKAIFCVFIFLIFVGFNFAKAEELNLEPRPYLNLKPLDIVGKAGIKGISAGDVLESFKLNLPFNLDKVNIDTNIPISPKVNTSQQTFPDINLKQFLTPKNLSPDDLKEAIRAMVTLIIEIFLVVISIASQMLKVILGFLSQ